MSAQERVHPLADVHISPRGLKFLYRHEARPGISNRLHWPGGASGVTLGAGYDMKHRRPGIILKDLTAIGVSMTAAKQIAPAGGLSGRQAEAFARNGRSLLRLSSKQEMQLLALVVPEYERIVRCRIGVPLMQHQFDALVSFAYNPGGRLRAVARSINMGAVEAAMAEMQKAVTSGGRTLPGLVQRRKDEVNLYRNADYGPDPVQAEP